AEEPVAEETEAKAEESVAEAVEAVAQAVVAEEIAEDAVEAVAEVIAENEDNGEAFDEPDAGVADVSQGVTSVIDAPTEELPKISESQLSAKEQKKEEKKRLKQEAAEARAREKEEAKEQKRLEKEERKANKKKGKGKLIFGLLLLLIAACAVVYLGLSNRYKTVFFDGTKINGADCTGLTVEETETVITRQMDTYDLKLVFRDGKQELITGDSVGFEYVPDGSVQEIKDSQVPIKWASAFFQEYSYDATASSKYDEAKLTQTITGLEECNIVNMTPPQDAYLTFNETTHQFEIVPEQNGNKFDLTSLITTIQDAIINGVTEIDVESLDIYENPTITSDNAELIAKRDDLNGVISPVITYTLPNGTEKVLDKTTLVTWLEHDENGNYSFNEELWGNNIANFVEDLAGEVNTSDSTAEFKTHSGGTVNLENFLQGWLIDDEEEGRKLAENLAARETVTREPIYSQRAFSDVNNGIGNTYVEVDLTAQHLWVVDNGQVINETPVVSGMMVYSRFTPEGIYPLYGKQQGRWLRGAQAADGSYEYESWVDYWMPFNGGIGLHDASWRVEFGGNIYVGGGSHGCVNLPHNKAAEIFDWIEGGTPIICYYTGGIQLADE
ncbi:MAG: L,D-transpeptidase/peptidoglycan binding protein, partial [Lachnospiraceae bacterium]|nr:L,D-transpeptidase/peptidoglycan binding protein [Lachnospiraceae bacterium]